jgi:hypothetical protein
MPPKPSSTGALTDRDHEAIVAAFKHNKNAFELDFEAYAVTLGLANAASGRTNWSNLKKKLKISSGGGEWSWFSSVEDFWWGVFCADLLWWVGDKGGEATAAAASRKRKVNEAEESAEGAADDDEEEVVKSPKKKKAAAKKGKKAAAEVKDEDEDEFWARRRKLFAVGGLVLALGFLRWSVLVYVLRGLAVFDSRPDG